MLLPPRLRAGGGSHQRGPLGSLDPTLRSEQPLVTVPDRAMLRRDNPDGRPILCRTPNGFIRCFVPPPAS